MTPDPDTGDAWQAKLVEARKQLDNMPLEEKTALAAVAAGLQCAGEEALRLSAPGVRYTRGSGRVRCIFCWEWKLLYPAGAENLECPKCGKMLGQEAAP